jgi:hypothetical protein
MAWLGKSRCIVKNLITNLKSSVCSVKLNFWIRSKLVPNEVLNSSRLLALHLKAHPPKKTLTRQASSTFKKACLGG